MCAPLSRINVRYCWAVGSAVINGDCPLRAEPTFDISQVLFLLEWSSWPEALSALPRGRVHYRGRFLIGERQLADQGRPYISVSTRSDFGDPHLDLAARSHRRASPRRRVPFM